MTSQFPDDMFIENSDIPQQLADGISNPQPGIIIDDVQPATLAPTAPARGKPTAAPYVAAVIAVILLTVGASAAVYFFANSRSDEAPADPLAEITRGAGGGPGFVEDEYPVGIGAHMYDKYVSMIDDESIFLIIPRTDEGWAYFSAFLYKIADYKAAELFGPLEEEQVQEMLALEARFLALEDLELTVDITRTDGTHFFHDGKPPSTEVAPSMDPSAATEPTPAA